MRSGAESVTEDEVLSRIVPAEHPEYRFRPSYRYGFDRLSRRGVIGWNYGDEGEKRYYLVKKSLSAEETGRSG